MEYTLYYREEVVRLQANEQAYAVVMLRDTFVVFYPQNIRIFGEDVRRIGMDRIIINPTGIGPEEICGILQYGRLMTLNIVTGTMKLLYGLPLETAPYKHYWWHCTKIFTFDNSACFGYREEGDTSINLKFFESSRYLSAMKYNKESIRAANTMIDKFDDDHTMCLHSRTIKNHRINVYLFDIKSSQVSQCILKNNNFREGDRVKMIRSLGEELLLVLDNKDEKEPYEAWYVVVNPVSMDILWAFSRQNTRFLKMLHIDTQKHQLLIEEIDTSHKKFQYCWFSYESLNGMQAVNRHSDLKYNGKYLFKLLGGDSATTEMLVCWTHKRKSLYCHLMNKIGLRFGSGIYHYVISLL